MKKTLGALLLTLGLIAALPLQAANAAPKVKSCAQILTAEGNYFTANGVATFGVGFDLVGTSCRNVDYVIRVLDSAGTELNRTVLPGDGTFTGQQIAVTAPGAPSSVCAEFFTGAGTKVFDTAPNSNDAECVTGMYFLLDGGTGGRPMG